MAKKQEKTNVMRILDQKKIQYSHYAMIIQNLTQKKWQMLLIKK